MTMCLSKYMLEEHGTLLKTHIGGIKRTKKDITTHMWSSYNGKRIDLTSHTQPDLRVNGMILDEPIETIQNAKLIFVKYMNTRIVKESAKQWIDICERLDKNDITVSHLLLKNIKTGLVPYEQLQKVLNYKIKKRTPFLYQNFFDYMNEEKAVA